MRSTYKIFDQEAIHFITSSTIEHIPIFLNETMFNILIDSFNFSRYQNGLKLYAFVIMDNHFHAIISGENCGEILRSIKRYTAKQIIETIKTMESPWLINQIEYWKKSYKNDSHYQIWQEGYHPKQILTEEMLTQKINYIHYNPVKRGFVLKPEDWKYSSARNFLGLDAIIDLDSLY